jgi:adenosine deaminase
MPVVARPSASEASWLERLPKIELHLHLEGAIPLDALWELVIKYGGDPDVPSLATLADRFAYRDFEHFIQTWHWKNRFLREYEDFAFIARRVGEDLAAQGVRYAEVFFSPPDFERYGLEPQGLAERIRSGLDEVAGIRVALVADLVRDTGPERADRTLEKVSEVRDCAVVGIGLGGSEHEYPAARFKDVFAKARRRGFRTSAKRGGWDSGRPLTRVRRRGPRASGRQPWSWRRTGSGMRRGPSRTPGSWTFWRPGAPPWSYVPSPT